MFFFVCFFFVFFSFFFFIFCRAFFEDTPCLVQLPKWIRASGSLQKEHEAAIKLFKRAIQAMSKLLEFPKVGWKDSKVIGFAACRF